MYARADSGPHGGHGGGGPHGDDRHNLHTFSWKKGEEVQGHAIDGLEMASQVGGGNQGPVMASQVGGGGQGLVMVSQVDGGDRDLAMASQVGGGDQGLAMASHVGGGQGPGKASQVGGDGWSTELSVGSSMNILIISNIAKKKNI